MQETFISEAIEPIEGSFDARGMARGEPGLPGRFFWRDKEYTIARVLEQWKESGPCKHGSSEIYLRKHWFKVQCTNGMEMTLYFERQPRAKSQTKKRWWLYTLKDAPSA